MFATAVIGSDLIGMWAFAGMVQFETTVVHSGLRVGALAERHDRHHEGGVVGGYATFEIVDWLFGTSMREVGLQKKRKMAEESKTLEADAVEERDLGSRKPVMKRTESSATTGRGAKLPLGSGCMKILARWRGSERLGTRIENANR